MHSFSPDFKFRGSRNYVHGTDMYIAITGAAATAGLHPDRAPLKMTIRRMARTQLEIHISDPGETQDKLENVVADFSFSVDGKPVAGWLVETGRPVTGSKDYDEAAIRSRCTIGEKTIALADELGFEPIEIISSMATHINTLTAPPQGGRKWVFTRLDLTRPLGPTDSGNVEVKIVQSMGGILTKSVLSSAGKPIGSIYFSLAEA
jgi:hypothetical protein